MSGGLARYGGNDVSEKLSRYVESEVAVKVYSISTSLNRRDRESAMAIGKELLDSMGRELSTKFILEPKAQSLSLEISEFIGNIHKGEDTIHSLSRVYGEIGDIVPWIKKDGVMTDNKDGTMPGNYPVD
ncbi:MAG: hypothetical protein KAT35_01930 [Candidatus Aenigmarchaeota archaeon]|nr:hypothetical protein [Candidatus Aenigmarchaeota archaeon]